MTNQFGRFLHLFVFAMGVSVLLSFSTSTMADDWFRETTPLTQAHQKLLEDDLSGSFSAMVQVWQSDSSEYTQAHLNQLLLKSLEEDCGKSLWNQTFTEWIDRVVVKRQSLQSPGRRISKAIVEVLSAKEINSINLYRWPDKSISSEVTLEKSEVLGKVNYRVSFDLNQRLPSNLYRLEVTSKAGDSWESWVILEDTPMKERVRWESKDSWAVDKKGMLNPYCPLPRLNVSLYDFLDKEYVRVWNKDYESQYPSNLPLDLLEPSRYVLAVSITHQRWQGQIAIQEQQVISKTYDVLGD